MRNPVYSIVFTFLILLGNSFFLKAGNIEFTEAEKKWIKDHPIIYHGYEPNWAPFEIYVDGEYTGIVGDYINIIERETGLDIRPIPDITWNETLEKLKTGEVMFTACAGITPEREEYLLFTKPYLSSPMVIVTRKDGQFVSGLEDLKGKTIALPKNYYTAEMISKDYPEINIQYHDVIEDAIQSVSLGQADAFVGNLVVACYYVEHKGYTNLKVAAPTDYQKAHIGFAANKEWPELISIVQKVFDQISYEEKNAILQKWIYVRYEHGVDMKFIWKVGIYSLVAVLIILGGILFWNETLKKEIKNREHVEEELAKTLKEVSAQNDERKTLLGEIHHRLKNNLHMVSGLLKLQALESGNKEVEKQLNEAVERVRSIAFVHDKIHKSEDQKNLNLKDYIEPLLREIIGSFAMEKNVKLNLDCNVELKNTRPLVGISLIFNELTTNTLKYAFKATDHPEITISLKDNGDGNATLYYADNGKWKAPSEQSSFGLSLIEIFTEQLGGTYTRDTENGTSYTFEFKDFYNPDF